MDGTACVGGPGNDEQTVCGQCGVLFDNSYPLGAYAINWFANKNNCKNKLSQCMWSYYFKASFNN